MAIGAISGSNKSQMATAAILKKIQNGHISATGCPIHSMNKFKMDAAAILDNFEWPYLRNSSRSTYIARIARSFLR